VIGDAFNFGAFVPSCPWSFSVFCFFELRFEEQVLLVEGFSVVLVLLVFACHLFQDLSFLFRSMLLLLSQISPFRCLYSSSLLGVWLRAELGAFWFREVDGGRLLLGVDLSDVESLVSGHVGFRCDLPTLSVEPK
jgi:hypothetical protein